MRMRYVNMLRKAKKTINISLKESVYLIISNTIILCI